MNQPSPTTGSGKLKKELGLWDVYCISTGAMFSSGFFLLPGLATAYAGPSTVLAYLLAGFLMIPAMLSMAELSTALPRAGGTYYFLDRSLGPVMGTVGGLGTWMALVLKSGFALLGMGAYLAIAPGISNLLPHDPEQTLWVIKALAVAMTVVFTAVNIFGAKETTRLQGWLVIALLAVLTFFTVQGLWYVFFRLGPSETSAQFTPFLHENNGFQGMIATIGLVFVSYAGLTKVASVSEEVKRPDRNLPLGMFLSLLTATVIYVLGVFIMIAVLDREALRSDYTPVATAADAFFSWLPYPTGLILIVIAALAAFASTGNAGILSASRYPFAMARDRLIGERFGTVSRFGTPTWGILTTSGLMIFFIIVLSAEEVAKMASAFNLFVFGAINIAVIVMRESRIDSYDPGYRCPLYPWTQLVGLAITVGLIAQLGWLSIIASLALALIGLFWYFYYARPRVQRHGAIYHIFARLGAQRFEGLDRELRGILKEKGLRADDPYDQVVARADVIDISTPTTFENVVKLAAERLDLRLTVSAESITSTIMEGTRVGATPVSHGVALPHLRLPDLSHAVMILVRTSAGIHIETEAKHAGQMQDQKVYAVIFLASPEDDAAQHLRILAQVAQHVDDERFMQQWLEAETEHALRQVLLHEERFLSMRLTADSPAGSLIGHPLRDLALPEGCLVAVIDRADEMVIPRGGTTLMQEDLLIIVGLPESIAKLRETYRQE
jgi:amino acid transporter/mannitol/fructose-specific phosphotransferase system IIA component (Ntr-type)